MPMARCDPVRGPDLPPSPPKLPGRSHVGRRPVADGGEGEGEHGHLLTPLLASSRRTASAFDREQLKLNEGFRCTFEEAGETYWVLEK
jgi:hypothetical protein